MPEKSSDVMKTAEQQSQRHADDPVRLLPSVRRLSQAGNRPGEGHAGERERQGR